MVVDGGRGEAGCQLTRGMPLVSCGEFLGRGIAERRMGPAVVVIEPPGPQWSGGVGEIEEPVLVEAFIAESPVEAFDEGVLGRLAEVDEVEPDAVAPGPLVEHLAEPT